MTQVVQARCPKCQKVLRIPAEWALQPLRCKHCQQIFQGKAPPPNEQPADVPASLPFPVNQGLFDNLDQEGPLISSPHRSRRSRGWGKRVVFLVFLLLLGGAGAVAYYRPPALMKLLRIQDSGPPIVKNDKSPPEDKPRPKKIDTPKKKSDTDPDDDPPPTKKDPPVTKKETTEPKKVAKGAAFPRRALLINVNDYLLMNPVFYGAEQGSTAALAYQFMRPPFNMQEQQVTELSDGIPESVSKMTDRKAKGLLKDVIENTLADFLDSSRPQDRIIVVFAGHAVDGDKMCYLVPIEGNKDDVKTLVSLGWVLDRLAKCKARQKLLILDVCRFPPARGLERPASGEMSEQLDTMLKQPPDGVQVWCSCIKGQQSIELEKGSIFLQSLVKSLQKGVKGIQEPTNPLPLDTLVPDVNERLRTTLKGQKMEQVSRLAGKEQAGGAAYDPEEEMPQRLAIRPPTVNKGEAAGAAQVKAILDELNHLPTVRDQQTPIKVTQLPPFSVKVLEEYRADYKSWSELMTTLKKQPEKYPLREAVREAIGTLEESRKLVMEDRIGGDLSKAKAAFLLKQRDPGLLIFEMQNVLDKLKTVSAERDKETSKRWQANYDFALVRMQSRLVYIYEYNYLLGQVRADNLPPLEPGVHSGWLLGSRPKVQVPEPRVKELVKTVNRSWKRIAEQYPGTPWAIMATRENLTALGLEWRLRRD